MRAEELDSLTDQQLQEEANICFVTAENLKADDAEKLRLLFEAQFYLAALTKRRDDRTAERDFRMEKIVIGLISVEIVLSLIFGFWGLWEGNQQATVLTHMEASSAATATAMGQATTQLQRLAEEQKRSADRLQEMSDSLQASTGAARGQLKILQQEQADTLAERSKKPKLVFLLDGIPLDPIKPPAKVTMRAETDTSMTIDFAMINVGAATAHSLLLRAIMWTPDVNLIGEGALLPVLVQSQGPHDAARVFTMQVQDLRPRATMVLPLTFTFPKGHNKFNVVIHVDADEIETGTQLAVLQLNPRT